MRLSAILPLCAVILASCSAKEPDAHETPPALTEVPTAQASVSSPALTPESATQSKTEKLYFQPLEYPYSTTWYGRIVKKDGLWRDVFVETNEKVTAKGVLSFDCPSIGASGGTAVAWFDQTDDTTAPTVTKYKGIEIERWKGEDEASPPYELYVAAQSKYC